VLASCSTSCYRKQAGSSNAIDLPSFRGCHPFDRHQDVIVPGSDHDDASQISTSSELETKQRIVRGHVDFCGDIWNTLPSSAFSAIFITI
jgi:hypothetical protein